MTTPDLTDIYSAVYRYCRSRLHGDNGGRSADDVAQDTMLDFIAMPLDEIRSPLVFALHVAHCHIVDDIKRRKRNKHYPTGVGVDLEGLIVGDFDELVIDRVDHGERRVTAMLAMKALTDRQRQVMWLRSGLNCPAAEVGERMGMAAGTVRVAHLRALARVRAVVREVTR